MRTPEGEQSYSDAFAPHIPQEWSLIVQELLLVYVRAGKHHSVPQTQGRHNTTGTDDLLARLHRTLEHDQDIDARVRLCAATCLRTVEDQLDQAHAVERREPTSQLGQDGM